MPTLTAYVANCLMGGDEITRHPEGSFTRDVIRFKCDRWEFRFLQRLDVAQGKIEPLKGTFCETSTVEIENVEPDQIEEVLEVLNKICWLLSFASQSRVICYGHQFPEVSKIVHFKSAVGAANYFRPPFDLRDSATVRKFVEQTYPTYRLLSESRKLAVVFDYLVQAERPGQPTEIRLLLLFVTLENLKDTYASEKGIPYVNGFYRKPPAKPGKEGEKFSFKELLIQMLCSVSMTADLKQVVNLRNEIIHSGLSRELHAHQWAMYEHIQDLVREYVFRLLAYRGEFFTYASQGMDIKTV